MIRGGRRNESKFPFLSLLVIPLAVIIAGLEQSHAPLLIGASRKLAKGVGATESLDNGRPVKGYNNRITVYDLANNV